MRIVPGLFAGCAEGVHQFEPRYDKGPAELTKAEFTGFGGLAAEMETMRKVTYVRDVCVRCGKVIERNPIISVEQEPLSTEQLRKMVEEITMPAPGR